MRNVLFFFFEDIYFFFCIEKSTQKLQIKIILKMQFCDTFPILSLNRLKWKCRKKLGQEILAIKFTFWCLSFIITAIFFYLHLSQIFAHSGIVREIVDFPVVNHFRIMCFPSGHYILLKTSNHVETNWWRKLFFSIWMLQLLVRNAFPGSYQLIVILGRFQPGGSLWSCSIPVILVSCVLWHGAGK